MGQAGAPPRAGSDPELQAEPVSEGVLEGGWLRRVDPAAWRVRQRGGCGLGSQGSGLATQDARRPLHEAQSLPGPLSLH